MKMRTVNLLGTALAMICVNVLIACAQKGNGPSSSRQGPRSIVTPQTGNSSPETSGLGGFDSGGGTGVSGRVFESYIVNPINLPAFKQHLEPLLSNIKSEEPGNQAHYDKIFKMKTWYIAPIELTKISKDVLGVSFIKSATQQIARQTPKEVWIDKQAYDAMNSREQAELLLHEMVMNMYFLKFMSMTEICRVSVMVLGDKENQECARETDFFNKAMPPEKVRPLNDQDNENIRFVTGWLIQNAKSQIAEVDFMRLLFHKGFDKRIFNPAHYGKKDQTAELKIPGKELYRAIKGAELTGNMPTQCVGLASGKSKSCKLEIEGKSITYRNFQLAGYNLRLNVEGEAPVNLFAFIGDDEATLSANEDGDGSIIYSLFITDWQQHVRVGNRLYSGFMMFRKETSAPRAGLILDSVILNSGIVISIDKKRDPICMLRAPKPVAFLDEVILVRQHEAKSNSVQQLFSATPPFATCDAEQVIE